MLSMRPGTMRDEFITVALKILERASRKLNHNIVKNGARVYAFTSESPGVLTLNTVPFYISRTPLLAFADAQKKRFRLIPLIPCFHRLEDGGAPQMFIVQGLGDARFQRIPSQEFYKKKSVLTFTERMVAPHQTFGP